METRIMRDARLSLQASSGEIVKEKVAIYAVRHNMKALDGRARRAVMLMPSLLGRDILERYRVVYDRPGNRVYLER